MTDHALGLLERMAEKSLAVAERIDPRVDCRTCSRYLQGLHACNLFSLRGQECVEGSHWEMAAFSPLWKVSS